MTGPLMPLPVMTNQIEAAAMYDSPEVVKDICAVAPYIDRAVFAKALIIKAIHLQLLTY